MSDQVALELEAGVALLTLNHPPTNSLTHDLRAELASQLEAALHDDAVDGVLLRSTGDWFSAGWDLVEFHEANAPPSLSPISDLLENATKPAVAVLDGTVLSSGLELALCAHARVARAGTKVGIPEVNVGLMPGSGATQRLPRLIGAQASLKLLLGGKALDVAAPEMQGLIDRITDDDPEKQAKKLLRSMISRDKYQPVSTVSRGLTDTHGYQAAITSAREQIKVPDSAATDILDCVEAALLLPFEQGLRFEETRYHARVKRKSARVQLHSFAAERYAKSLPNGFAASAAPVSHVAVIGGSHLATDGAIMPLLLGHQVTVNAGDEAEAQAALNRIQKRLAASFPKRAAELGQSLMPATEAHGVAQAGLIIDCAEKSDSAV